MHTAWRFFMLLIVTRVNQSVYQMDNYKLERIRSLSDEVNDLHPLLKALFPKLPNITNTDYTHGPREMGADFILTKRDNTLDKEDYIGIIVKVGKIKQDHGDVERQIDECELERTIQGGTKKITLTEIWIITNNGITTGAQDKIHHKYRYRNITFINDEKLCQLIDKYFPEYWKDVTVETGEYLRSVAQHANNLNNKTSLIDSSSFYVPQNIIKKQNAKNPYSKKIKHQKTSLEKELETESHIIIEAMMGSGKSTLLSQLALHYSDSEVFNTTKILPIIITAKEMLSTFQGDTKRVVEEIYKNKVEPASSYILMIDALDELKIDNEEKVAFIKSIHETSTKLNFACKVVITSREIDEFEATENYEKLYSRYQLCPLTVKQVINLVENICKDTNATRKLEQDLDKSHLFRVLPKTPISAILLARLLSEDVQEIPSTMTDLYSKYMELVLGRWDMSKGLQSQKEYDAINNVTINIATFVMENSLVEIPKGDVKSILDNYVDSRNLKIDKEKIFSSLVKKREVFSENTSKQTIAFRHRTFSEYFYALGLHRDNTATISEDVYDIYWSNSFFFFLGIKRDCPELLKAIDELDIKQEPYKLMRTYHSGNFLLAAYLTPYESISQSLVRNFNEAAKLYETTLNKENANSPLINLSKVQLLCIITNCLCNSYSYEYFKPALKEHSLELCTRNHLNELELTELFLVNSALASMEDSSAYDKMIENYGKHIPHPLQIGILEHSDENKVFSTILKRYTKNFMRNMKTNLGFRRGVFSLYEKPISKLK